MIGLLTTVFLILVTFPDYSAQRMADPIAANSWIARQIIPDGSEVGVSYSRGTYGRVKARYYLYPLTVGEGDYFVTYGHSGGGRPFIGWDRVDLAGAVIYARPGYHLESPLGLNFPRDTPLPGIVFALTCILALAIGRGWLSRLGIEMSRWGCWSAAYLIGFFVLNFSAWILAACGLFTRPALIILWGTIGVISVVANWRHRLKTIRIPVSLIDISLAVVLISLLFFFLIPVVSSPDRGWDSYSFWLLKSKIVEHTGQLDLGQTHSNQYPMLWPIATATQFILVGDIDADQSAPWASAMMLIALAGVLGGAAKSAGAGRWGWAIPIVFLMAPGLWTRGAYMYAYPEICFAAYWVLLIFCGLRYSRDGSTRYLILGGVTALALSAVKIEAALFIPAIVLALALTGRKKSLLWLIPAVAVPLGWRWLLIARGYSATTNHLMGVEPLAERIPLIWAQWRNAVVSPYTGLLAVGAAISLCRKWTEIDRFLLILLVCILAIPIVSIMGWDREALSNLSYTGPYRQWVRGIPILLLLAIRSRI